MFNIINEGSYVVLYILNVIPLQVPTSEDQKGQCLNCILCYLINDGRIDSQCTDHDFLSDIIQQNNRISVNVSSCSSNKEEDEDIS